MCVVVVVVFFSLLFSFLRARTHTHAHRHELARDGLLLGAGCRSSARPLYYPVRLNSILKKPIIYDKSAALGFVVSYIVINEIRLYTDAHARVYAVAQFTVVATSVGQMYDGLG